MKKILIAALIFLLAGSVLAYDFKDAIRESAPGGDGVDASLVFAHYLRDVLAFGEADNEAEDFFKELVNQLSNFSFAELYHNKHFSDWPSGYRGVCFRADFVPGKYDYRMAPHDQTLRDRSELSGVGAFISEFSLRQNDNSPIGGKSYSLLFEGDATSANLSHENILRLIDNLLRISDPGNLDLLAKNSGLTPEQPLTVLGQLARDFPRLSSMDGIVKLEYEPTIFEHQGARYNFFKITLGFDPVRLKQLHPHLAKYIKKLAEPGFLEIEVKNEQGNTLTNLRVDFQEQEIVMVHCTREGKVAPYRLRGNEVTPFWEQAFVFSALQTHAWDAHVQVYSASRGIRFRLENVVVRGQYDYNREDMSFSLALSSLPKPEISGAVFGFIPLAIVDLFIPGTIQGLADDFALVMSKANYGAGSYFSLDWHQADPSFWWLHWKAETEMVDSYLVRTGARFISRQYRMNDKTLEDAYQLVTTGVKYLIADLNDMKQ